MEAGIKFVKQTMKKCFDANKDVSFIAYKINTNWTWTAKPSLILIERLVRGLLPEMNITLMVYNYDDKHYHALEQRQHWAHTHDIHIDFNIIPVSFAVAVQREDGGP